MEERQTTGTMFLRLVATMLQSRHKVLTDASAEVACKFMGGYLEFRADPTVVFVGYQLVLPKERPDGRSPDESF